VRISSASAQGERAAQEDRYVIHHTQHGTLLAVMDGHGGSVVAEVCKDYLAAFWDVSVLTENYDACRPFDKALTIVAWQLDSVTNEYNSGSTISLVFIPKNGSQIHVATLGDSPVITREPSGVCHVSPSHNVRTNLAERAAAVQRGGVYRDGYIWNGYGDLAEGLQMARSLGDGGMGAVISKEPTVETVPLGDFVLLGTDGLFDPGHENELQAIAHMVEIIDQGGEAQALVDRALQVPTGDNATALLVTR
jgi:serine/threonine protein phosphatase PrpC